MNLVSILITLCNNIEYWSKRFKSIGHHNATGNQSFFLHLLGAYRKKGSKCYSFSGQGKVHHIYTFCTSPIETEKDFAQFMKEKWKQGEPRKKNVLWTAKVTGVGPLAWHCNKDSNF